VFCRRTGRIPSPSLPLFTCGGKNTNACSHCSALTHDKKTALAGQIARACAVFCVDEVVVFDDGQAEVREPEEGGYTAFSDPNYFLFHILSYLETPPNLRKALFPMHPDLRTAGALPSLDMPHHLRSEEWCPYREAVAVRRVKGTHTIVDCGLLQEVTVPMEVDENARLTIKLGDDARAGRAASVEAEVVSPETPREEGGYYWGYSVRQAPSLSAIFTECPFNGGYDVSVGTSERGEAAGSLLDETSQSYVESNWSHLMIVFGGVAGLEAAFACDAGLSRTGIKDVKELFDRWVNLVPGQGSRTIRTEEAVWIGLTRLRELVEARDTA
jgi:methyltransferase